MATKVDVGVLQRLSELDGPSGFEGEVREYVRGMAERAGADVEVDRIGNVIASVKGPGPHVMLIAHMDEIGLMVSDIDHDGFLMFTTLGGWDPRLLPGLTVRVLGSRRKLYGTVGMKPPHITTEEERRKVLEPGDLFVDTGLDPGALTKAGVRVGTPMVPANPFRRLARGRVMGKAFDDRAGCYMLMRLLHEGGLPCRATYVWSVQEELGMRGAGPAVERVDPDYAVVLECTIAADFPGVPPAKVVSRMRGGPVLTVMDRAAVSDPGLVDAVLEEAKASGTPVQIKKPGIGATDAGSIHLRRLGYRSVALALPGRYIHGPEAILDLKDVEATLGLARALVARLAKSPR
jgi:endoglucanase